MFFTSRILLALTIIFSVNQNCKAQDPTQWNNAFGPSFRHLNAVEILPNNKIVAIGGWEFNDAITTIVSTSDTCTTWNISLDFVNAILQDLDFSSSTTGYSVGWAGNIWKTVDSGDSWSQITVPGNPGTRNFNGCHFFNDNIGVVVGGNQSNDAIQTILKTTDGGNNWSIISDNLAPWLRAVHFADNLTGFAVGDNGTILKTTNGGDDWSPMTVPGSVQSRQFNDVHFLSPSIGVAVGGWETNDSISTVLKTTDGGVNWTIVMDNLGSMLNGVHFFNANQGYAVGDDGVIYYTSDAGSTWQNQVITNNDDFGLNAVFFKDAFFGIAVGSDGKLLWYVDENANLASGTIDSPVTLINSNSASILGNVDDFGLAATIEFEYGTSIAFGSNVPMYPYTTSAIGAEETQITLTGLTPEQVYYGRMVMTNSVGTSYSNTVSFYTGITTVPNYNFELWDAFSDDILDDWLNTGSVSQTTSYNGTFAVQLTGSASDNVGAILYGNPGQNGLEGGTPFVERPDSIVFWANYDIALNDSALVVLQLKNNGVLIADSIYKIGGSSLGSFVEKKFKINYLSALIPDTMFLAFTSSDVFSGSPNASSVIAIDDVSFFDVNSNVPNNDMESWSVETRNKAALWVSNDDQYSNGVDYMVEQSTDSYSGDYAVKLNNLVGNNSNFARIKTGIDINSWNPVFPILYNHEKLYGYYKYFPADGDTLFVRVSLYENGAYIGFGELEIIESASIYTQFEVPLTYGPGNADSCSIEFSIFKNNGQQPGASYGIIDNLSFDAIALPSQNVGVNEVAKKSVKLYPNPTEGPITIEFDQIPSEEINILVVDLSGKILLEEKHHPIGNKLNIDINEISSQYCFFIIREGKKSHSFKILVK